MDEFTGRLMPGRRYSDGLHQAIEAKEARAGRGETQTLATITLQNFFRIYDKLAGMTGTAETEAREFWEIYKLDVVGDPAPTRCMVRTDQNDVVFRTKREKYNGRHRRDRRSVTERGQPVSSGTVSVEVSELLCRCMLKRRAASSTSVLNAEVPPARGRDRRPRPATRRGDDRDQHGRPRTDIKLGARRGGGSAAAHPAPSATRSRRIDRQLRGLPGRQGDPGSSRFYLSLEDDSCVCLERASRSAWGRDAATTH